SAWQRGVCFGRKIAGGRPGGARLIRGERRAVADDGEVVHGEPPLALGPGRVRVRHGLAVGAGQRLDVHDVGEVLLHLVPGRVLPDGHGGGDVRDAALDGADEAAAAVVEVRADALADEVVVR